MFDIQEVKISEEKTSICNTILRGLPDWFGIETSIIDYVNEVGSMPFFVAFIGNKPIGFVAIKEHNPYTSEIYVMGILQDYQRQGIGKKLIESCQFFCKSNDVEYLTVKTVDASRESQSYEKTRKFYLAMGFRPLEVFPLLWDESNPCLFLVKHIERSF